MAPRKGTGTAKADEKQPATNHGADKDSSSKGGLATLIKPSKGGVSQANKTKALKYAKEHSLRLYVFNKHEEANSVGVVIYGEKDLRLTSWLSKIADDMIRQETGDLEPIPFFNGTFFLHDEEAKIVVNDRN